MESSPYLEQLAHLASPVPNLAATLATPREQEVEDENVRFLRSRLPTPPTDPDDNRPGPVGSERSRRIHMADSGSLPPLRDARTGQVISRSDSESRRRMRMQMTAQQAPQPEAPRSSAQSQLTYAGWAPGSSDEEDEPYPEPSNVPQSSAQVYNEWSSRMRELRAARSTRGELSQLLDQVIETQNELDAYIRPTREARQALQASARSGTHLPLPQYLLDRERNRDNGDDPDRSRSQGNYDRAATILEQRRRQQLHREMEQRASRAQHDSQRQVNNHSVTSGGLLKPLEDAIQYLGYIRELSGEDEQVEAAKEAGLLRQEYLSDWNNFIFDPRSLRLPSESSWLRPGGNFAGTQRAAGPACLHLPHLPGGPRVETGSRRRLRSERMSPEELGRYDAYAAWAASRPSNTSLNSRSHSTQLPNTFFPINRTAEGEEWPVRVSIHGVDYSNMTLTGTMEASNVPDKSSPSLESSITTYLEGEIIDFNIHTLETKAFNANARTDGTYWRKLEPFRQLSDEQMVKNLLNKTWINEVLMANWVLMRWKGAMNSRMLFDLITNLLSRKMLCQTFGCSIVPDH